MNSDPGHRETSRTSEDSALTWAATPATMPTSQHLRLTTPAGLLTAIPHLLGFHPASSVVIIGTRPPKAKATVTMRYDLPDPPDPRQAARMAAHAAMVLATAHAREAVAVGYGPGHLVTTIIGELQARTTQGLLPLTEILRTADGSYWSYLCTTPGCCPPEGTPFDPAAEPAAALAAEGPVPGSRDELAASIARINAKAATMRRATTRAEQRAARLLAASAPAGQRARARSEIVLAGLDAVARAIARYRRGGQLPAGTGAAWLALALRDQRIRDDAWARMLPQHRAAHLRLWQDLTRLAQPGYVAAPASLLALVAWQSGNGALANLALDRALADDPAYKMARLLRRAIDSGAPPARARPPMTPEDVATYYDDADSGPAVVPSDFDNATTDPTDR
jgi:hypothetical protein